MQFAKDTFYMALRERLGALSPSRRSTVNGVDRIAIVVLENEVIVPPAAATNTFYLEWGGVQGVDKHGGGRRPLQAMHCVITYRTSGTCDSGVDRGRMLAALDTELQSICQPPESRKRDFTQSPSRDLGTCIFWTAPELGAQAETKSGKQDFAAFLERSAHLSVFYFPEVDLT